MSLGEKLLKIDNRNDSNRKKSSTGLVKFIEKAAHFYKISLRRRKKNTGLRRKEA